MTSGQEWTWLAPRRKAPASAPFVLFLLLAPSAHAQEEAPQATRPPPNNLEYLVTGVALTAEVVPSAGDMCPDTNSEPDTGTTPGDGTPARVAPCILEQGGGLGIRVGYRTRGPWYAGAAYEFSRHESSNLLRLAILQQLRGELRYYLDLGTRATPYAGLGVGLVIYGNEWQAETGGLTGMLGPGVELQVTQDLAVGCALYYRPMLFRGFTDTTGLRRADRAVGFGISHVAGFELIVELRDPVARW